MTLVRLEQFVQQTSPSAIVLVGDVTDTGDSEAWERVGSITRHLGIPVYGIPGNHDVHFAGYNRRRGRASYSTKTVLSNLNHVVTPEGAEGGFPKVVRIGTVLVVLLNSNGRESSGPVTNALGYVGSGQLREAEKLLNEARRPEDVVVTVLHHHLLLPEGGPAIWYLRCLDAAAVLDFAARNRVAATVNGHLHMPFVAKYPANADGNRGEILVVSCGSLHHHAEGPLAAEIELPSAYLMDVDEAGAITISLISASLSHLRKLVVAEETARLAH